MALAKERSLEGSQTRSLYGNVHGGGSSIQGLDPSSLELFSYKGHNDVLLEDGDLLPMLSNSSDGGFVFGSVNSSAQGTGSIVNVDAGSNHWAYSGSSVLSFEQGDRVLCTGYPNIDHEDESAIWMDDMVQNLQLNNFDMKRGTDSRFIQDRSCFDMGSGYTLVGDAMNENQQNKKRFGLLYLGAAAGDGRQESAEQEKGIQKCPYMGGELQASKKHCRSTRKTKAKPGPSKDPLSIAAKNRRERISERLKILQDLIPNGSKVDLVTMLEKAISYVKFLQLQVKVLATDEFWPAQGGKAPEVSQVKEAIDAILSSHRGSNSSS